MINVSTKNLKTEMEFKIVDAKIDAETKRKVELVKGSSDFNIGTACFIDGEFILVSEFEINESYSQALKSA